MQGDQRETTSLSSIAQVAGIILCLLVASPLVGLARAQSLRGVVLDASNRVPIAGTAIQLQPDRGPQVRRATTDSTGAFSITAPEAGLYRVTATRLGFVQHRGDTVRLGNSETVTVEIHLDRTAIPLRPVIVTERVSGLPDGFEARKAQGFGRFLTRKDIAARQGSQTSDILRGMPGLVLLPVRRGRGPGNTLAFRGPAGLCAPAVWIDGVLIAGSAVDEVLPPTTLEAVEVYNSSTTAPIQYRTGNCGVVLFWTKRGDTENRAKIKWWKLLLGAATGVGLVFFVVKK